MLYQRFGQAYIVCVDVQDVRIRIERGTSPLRSSVPARKHHSVLADTVRDKLPLTDESPQLLERPLVRLSRSVRH